jgi:preprotein translocase subunit SecD/SecD/SecF fusion protein
MQLPEAGASKFTVGGRNVKKVKKPVFFLVLAVIAIFAVTTLFGVHTQYGDIIKTYVHGVDDIRLGIDIQGGVDVTFEPAGGVDATDDQMDAALEKIKTRMVTLGINDSDTYVDYKSDRIIVRFPWQAGETDFDPEEAVKELGETAELTFRYGTETTTDDDGNTIPAGEIVLTGDDVESAGTGATQDDTTGDYTWMVTLELNDSGTEKFYEATSALYEDNGQISIWMDNTMISAPSVNAVISDGSATITGNFTYETAKELADKINSGALPFSLETTSFKTISPTMGEGALTAMIIAGLIAVAFIVIYMIVLYRLMGVVASICLFGQIAGMLAAVSGWFGFMDSNTLTIPGIAGIILSIGMGVDANIITGERVREELRRGKPLESALQSGYSRAFSAIFDGNLTGIIVAIILMGAFGTPDSWCAKLLNPLFQFFGATTEGVIYSFGYTLMTGLIMNFIMGVFAAKLMTLSLSKFKCFQNKKLYGGGLNG